MIMMAIGQEEEDEAEDVDPGGDQVDTHVFIAQQRVAGE